MPKCWKADISDHMRSVIHYDFSSTIFRIAMKTHRQGHDTANLINLLTYGTRTSFTSGFVEQCSFSARIQDGSLLMREQRIFMIPTSQKSPNPWSRSLNICPHIEFLKLESLYSYQVQIPCSLKNKGYDDLEDIKSCGHCYTEFRIDFTDYGTAGHAMFVTRWMDLGDGRDPSDSKWESRVRSPRWGKRSNVTFQRGAICAAFEQKADSEFEFDSLLTAELEKVLRKAVP